jgi:hypothetical protein
VKNGEGEPKSNHRAWNPEKRRHPRYRIDLPIEYTRRDLVVRHDRAINASEGGLLAHFSEQLEVGQYLRIKLYYPSCSAFNFIELVTQVVWTDVHSREDGRDCPTGVRVMDISIEDLGDLKNFLASLSG